MMIPRNPLVDVGYTPKTTFWMDFSIADRFGVKAVKGTYRQAFSEWKHDIVYMTELVMVLNHKIWQHYQSNDSIARLYNDMWREADEWCCENFTGDDLTYYYSTTD